MNETARPPRLPQTRRAAVAAALFGGALVLGGPARAEPPSAEALQAQLRAAFSGMLATEATGSDKGAPDKVAGSPLTVTRQGDRYSILFAINGMQPDPPDPQAGRPAGLQAVVHPIDGGRWAIDSLALPSASTMTFAAPPGGLKDAGTGTMHVHIDQQSASGVFDPSYATASTLDARVLGVQTTTENAELRQQAHYDGYQAHVGLTPHPGSAGAVTLDMDQTTELTGLHLAATGKTTYGLDAARAHLNGAVIALSPERVGALYGAILRVTGAVLAGPPAAAGAADPDDIPAPLPLDKTSLRALLDALPGLADRLDVVESAEGVKLKTSDGQTYTFDRAEFGLGGAVTDGVLASYLDISLDNLQAPEAAEDVRALLPRHVHLHPTLGGIGSAELLALANAGLARGPGGDSTALTGSLLGLFAHGGIKFGVSDLAIELGDSTITGSGQVTIPAPLPTLINGEGHFVAKNFDALVARLQADPKAAPAVGFLATAKKLGKPEGDTLVWNIAYHDGAMFVNGRPLNPPPRARQAAPAPKVQ